KEGKKGDKPTKIQDLQIISDESHLGGRDDALLLNDRSAVKAIWKWWILCKPPNHFRWRIK
ncbi:MAG: hypothetical protein KDC43_17230, partial [Saprospiraceae bacterium]|nr:hypothetical protein [Saprospiraceae bacterium]MCB0683145.1 hypothetical protein [Saprospiraceae bacterium]